MPAVVSHHAVVTPTHLDEALQFLADHRDEGWVPLAGGTDVMVGIYRDHDRRQRWLNLQQLRPQLSMIEWDGNTIRIGAMVTMTQLRRSSLLRHAYPLIRQAAAVVGARQIQNRATVGGNIVNASPAGDTLPVWLVLNAELELTSQRGTRRVPYGVFMTGYRQTVLAADELLTAVVCQPLPSGNWWLLFRKVGTRAAQAVSKVVFAGIAGLDAEGYYTDVRLAFGSMGPHTVRAWHAERRVIGHRPSETLAHHAADTLALDLSPIDDVRSTAAYRMRVARNLLWAYLSAQVGERYQGGGA
jgi:CO/xanthine dehydrogenase FAD-binding subunit